jgi:ABC-type lipoprotein export system ATPase subunit
LIKNCKKKEKKLKNMSEEGQEETIEQIKTNFGMIIVGPSGSGKSTLTDGLQQFF